MPARSPPSTARYTASHPLPAADKRDWGVIEARFTTADGSGTLDSPLQVGLLRNFGVVDPLAGKSLLALSSGVARAPGQPGFTSECDELNGGEHNPPPGYPKRV